MSPPELILNQVDHRPWELPAAPWAMAQRWHDLLFAHWSFPPDVIQALLPPGLPLDTYDGAAWVGIVPFHMSHIRLRGLPPIPPMSAFPELNVRTYVTLDDKPGVWFFSLDATNRLGVEGARRLFHLPYFMAQIDVRVENDTVHYRCKRTDSRGKPGESVGTYRPTSAVYHSTPGTLEHWLTERYCLYARSSGGVLYRSDIHHTPWALQHAEAEFDVNTIARMHGIDLPDVPPLLHYGKWMDVLAWLVRRVDGKA